MSWLPSTTRLGRKLLRRGKTIIGTVSLARQFDGLIAGPLGAVAKDLIGPVVIILDALDECGSPGDRRELLNLLAEKIPKLPPNFRFIITSRKEVDIARAFSNESTVFPVWLDHESSNSKRDVAAYLINELDALFSPEEMKQSIEKDWPWEANMQLLSKTAGGLFIWASTSVKHITEFDITAFQRLDGLVKDIKSPGHAEFGLDALYSSVLQYTQIPWSDKETRVQFSNILYLILETGITLSTDDIDGILGLPSHKSSTRIISRLQSVLAYSPSSASRIRPLHASFAEFLKSEGQSQKPWYMNIAASHTYITERCLESFQQMDSFLHFNMCEIETSFTRNDSIPDLHTRIKQYISPELENACVYWIQQLRILPYSPDLLPPLDRFLHYHLLSWLEVLSLKGRGKLANTVLVDAIKWITVSLHFCVL